MNFINNGGLYTCIKISENEMNEYLEKFKEEEREHNYKFGPIQPPLVSHFYFEIPNDISFIVDDIIRNTENHNYRIVFLTKDYFIESILLSIEYGGENNKDKMTCILERYESIN